MGSGETLPPPAPVARNLLGEFNVAGAPAMTLPDRPVLRTDSVLPPSPRPSTSGLDDLVNGSGQNSIGQAVTAAASSIGGWEHVVQMIANRLSQPSLGISGDDFIFLWERSGGETLLEAARRGGSEHCRQAKRMRNACFALLLLIGEMPLPAESQARTDALELIGFSQFAADHEDALWQLLSSTTNDYSLEHPVVDMGQRPESQAVLVGFAANWIERIPAVVNNPSRRAVVLRHRLYRYMLLNDVAAGRGGGRYIRGLDFAINRAQAFAESYGTLAGRSPAELRRGVASVNFRGEEAVGQGVVREFYTQISTDVYASDYALFEYRGDAPSHYRISQMADHHPRECFVAIGRFMAMSIVQGIPIGVNMNPMFYKRLLGEALTLADVEGLDEGIHRSIQMVMRMTTDEELEAIGAPMPHAYPEHVAEEDSVAVTLENRDTQLAIALDNISVNHMQDQFDWFRQGFFAVIPRELFAGVSAADLGSILFGDPIVDIDDMVAHLTLERYVLTDAPIQYLLTVLRELSQEQRRQFLKFTTSNTQLPLGGFGALNPRFKITRVDTSPEHMPATHTCFNTIDLPRYTSLEQTREKILYAITHGIARMENY